MLKNLATRMTRIGTFPLDTLIPVATKHGYDSIEFPLFEIKTVDHAREAALKLRDSGLEWGLMPMDIDIMRECTDDEFESDLLLLTQQMDLAEAAGVKRYYNHVWPGSNERSFNENFEWCVKRFGRVYKSAKEHGLQSGFEFLGPKPLHDAFKYPFIRNLKDILTLADAISAEVGVLVDTYHWYTSGSTLEDLDLLQSGERVVGVHLNDGWKGRTRDEQEDMEREMPLATGVIDAVSVIKKLDEMGFNGPVTVEPFEPAATRLKNMPLDDACKEVVDSIKKVFNLAQIQ